MSGDRITWGRRGLDADHVFGEGPVPDPELRVAARDARPFLWCADGVRRMYVASDRVPFGFDTRCADAR